MYPCGPIEAMATIRSQTGFFYGRDFEKAQRDMTNAVQGTEAPEFYVAESSQKVLAVIGFAEKSDAQGTYYLHSFAVRAGA
ncbi:MAG: hypothetical protein AB1445_01425 [Bacillota bacterium]